jgi:uncharacterized protein YraI
MNATESSAMQQVKILFGLGVLVFSAMSALAKPAYVGSTVNLRAAPGTKSEIVAKIPGGSLVDTGDCSEGWCEVTWQDKKGFSIQTALDMSGRVPSQAARAPVNRPRTLAGPSSGYVAVDDPRYYAPPPGYYYAPGPYYRPYRRWRRYWW